MAVAVPVRQLAISLGHFAVFEVIYWKPIREEIKIV